MSNFEKNILTTFGAQGETWLQELPHLLNKYLTTWNLKANGNFENLSFNYVLPVLQENQTAAVLKLGPHRKGRNKEAQTLTHYAGNGAANIIAQDLEDGIILLEHVSPGNSLKNSIETMNVTDFKAAQIAGNLILKLTSIEMKSAEEGLTPVSVWGLGFEKFLREKKRGTDFPENKITKADALFKSLVQSTTKQVVLHGDLHHENILQGTREPWLAIDPKGLYGDPAFEVGAFIRNPMPGLANAKRSDSQLDLIIQNRIKALNAILPFGLDRIWGWSFSQSVLAAIWTVEDQTQDWRQWLRVADSLERIESTIS
jgi:streptomycin 6-kinase